MTKLYGKARFDPEAKQWVLDLGPDAMARFKRIFPKIPAKAMRTATLSPTPANARDLLWALDRYPLAMTPRDLAKLRGESQRYKEQESVLDTMLAAGYVPKPYAMALPPREYQRLVPDLVFARGWLLCADMLGLGKTVSGICVLSDPRARPGLVIVPTHLPTQWVRQIERFLPGMRTHVLTSGKPYDLVKACKGTFPDVVVTSYSKMTGWAPHLAELGFKSLIYDEIQALIHEDTARYAAALHLRDAIPYRLGLTATPLHNKGIEVHNILVLLGGDEVGPTEEFSREHCNGGRYVVDPKALGLTLRRSGWMIRRTTKEVGRELPGLNRVVHPVECNLDSFTPVQAEVIDLATRLLRAGGDGLDKMQAGGDLDWKLREATGVGKAPHVAAFVKMLLESDVPVLLSGWHRRVYAVWMDLLRDYKPVLYTGSETLTQKEASRDAFVKGRTNLFIISNRSGSGLDGLQHRCSTVVIGELDWSPAWHDQVIGRVHRDEQTSPVFAHFPIADEGSDPVLADILGLKRAQIDGICDPDAALIEKLQAPQERMKHLAMAWLAKHRPDVLVDLDRERAELAQQAEEEKQRKVAEREARRIERAMERQADQA